MRFDYGKEGLEIKVNPAWNTTVFETKKLKIVKDTAQAIRKAIKRPIGCDPLQKIVASKKKATQACVVVSDATRPVPSQVILEALVIELNYYGIQDEQIVVLIATGLHRRSREGELERILGKELKKRLRVVDHDATDKGSLKFLGNTLDGCPIYLNKTYCESDVKILTGYVEPHFFFGFSGGRKSIVPGIAGIDTIQFNHSAENIAHPCARFGSYKENPMNKHALEVTKKVGVDFVVNVCINEKHQITRIAAGDVEKVHDALVEFQLQNVFREIEEPFDIVVCGNGGYPLDLNLYQSVKSMAIGEMAVKEGGTVVSINEMSDGVGHENFKALINSGKTPKTIYDDVLTKKILVPDQWEIQILARVLTKAEVIVVSKLKSNELGNIGLKYAKNVEEAIETGLKKHGPNAKVLFLPNGPQVLPLLRNK